MGVEYVVKCKENCIHSKCWRRKELDLIGGPYI